MILSLGISSPQVIDQVCPSEYTLGAQGIGE